MADWQERITRETNPAVRIEHDVRYALAVPLIRDSEVWADLGCGNGVAAADALGDEPVARAVLVDVEQSAAEEAARTVRARETTPLRADLTDPADLARLRDALAGATGTITCFETVEHLANFAPLIETLAELSERFTVLLSVPNDAFWALENPYHQTVWSEGAFAELRSLLPAGNVVAHQVSLSGSAVVPEVEGAIEVEVPVRAGTDAVPTHFLAAFGPDAGRVAHLAAVTQTDLEERRRWERQREADLAFAEAAHEELRAAQARLDEANADLERVIGEREDFRRYIHELEERLGLPRSGGEPAALPPA
ncbi:MAG TPA: methyltransferase domain-containing protein [Solirubrobacteraceae bacterium]